MTVATLAPALDALDVEKEFDTVIAGLRTDLEAFATKVSSGFTLADAMRQGSGVTHQAMGSWGHGESACALSAAYIAARANGLL